MTRRERLERKLERRQEWAAGRKAKASGLLKSTERYRGDHAFNTQPGHIPERARVIAREDRAFENLKVAEHHEEKAAGLEIQLETSIFSDDPDAIEQLQAKIVKLEAQAARSTEINKAWRRGGEAAVAEIAGAGMAQTCAETMAQGYSWVKSPVDLTHLRAEIRRLKGRIADIERQQARVAGAAAAGGVKVLRSPSRNWCTVTFAEKPSRAILDALRAAGFRWGAGSWSGPLDKLPAEIT